MKRCSSGGNGSRCRDINRAKEQKNVGRTRDHRLKGRRTQNRWKEGKCGGSDGSSRGRSRWQHEAVDLGSWEAAGAAGQLRSWQAAAGKLQNVHAAVLQTDRRRNKKKKRKKEKSTLLTRKESGQNTSATRVVPADVKREPLLGCVDAQNDVLQAGTREKRKGHSCSPTMGL